MEYAYQWQSGHEISEMLDSIFIGILPLAFTLICFWLIAKKNVSINKMIIGVIVFGILASFLGIA
jgi:PTS system mannose-specific IID component